MRRSICGFFRSVDQGQGRSSNCQRPRRWQSQLGLSCRTIEATVDTCEVNVGRIFNNRKLVLTTPARGQAVIALNNVDFANSVPQDAAHSTTSMKGDTSIGTLPTVGTAGQKSMSREREQPSSLSSSISMLSHQAFQGMSSGALCCLYFFLR